MTQKASSANPNPKPPYILALDVGTSSTRTLLFDATGNTLPNEYKPSALSNERSEGTRESYTYPYSERS